MTDQTALVPAPDSRMSFGQTQLRPQDIVPPRVKVVQQMSQEAQDDRAKPGDFYNTLMGENMGPMIRVLPIVPFMQRILLVRREKRDLIDAQLIEANLPRLPEGDGLMCRSYDMEHGRGTPGVLCESECPLSRWDEVLRKPPLCTETYNVACQDEIGGLIVVSFQKSSAKVGKRLFSALRMRPGHPWATAYELVTRQQKNDLGTFYVPDFTVSKTPPAGAELAGALAWAEQLKGVVINVTPEDEEIEDRAPLTDAPPPF